MRERPRVSAAREALRRCPAMSARRFHAARARMSLLAVVSSVVLMISSVPIYVQCAINLMHGATDSLHFAPSRWRVVLQSAR